MLHILWYSFLVAMVTACSQFMKPDYTSITAHSETSIIIQLTDQEFIKFHYLHPYNHIIA